MIRSIFILLIIFLTAKISAGQTCVINSDSVVCIDDPIYFNIQLSGGTAQSYAWTMDENQNSSQGSPFAKYKQYGPKQITVTVTLAGGGTCQASKTIYVHPLPVASFQVENSSNFCLSKNNVCIRDLSVPGPTGSPIMQRVVLWGDGDASLAQNPAPNGLVCHKYLNEGKFTIIIEVTDIKGCIHRYSTDITIVKDVKALFGYQLFGNCDTASLCLNNLSLSDSSKLKGFYWLYGNGVVDSVNWLNSCYQYRDSGTFSPALVVVTPEGCTDTFRQNHLIQLNPVRFNIVKSKYQGCFGDEFTFTDLGQSKNFYFWYFRDSSNMVSVPAGEGNPFKIVGDNPGKIYISLTAIRGTCRSTYAFDSIEVFGPKADIKVTNNSICMIGDTTYFCDASNYKNTRGIKRFWDTDDTHCLPCTTDILNNLNIGMNCRYTNEINPKHVYKVKGCYTASLTLNDTITTCSDKSEKKVQIGRSDTSEFPLSYFNVEPCVGTSDSRKFSFFLPNYCGKYYINPDSAVGKNLFIPNLDFHLYSSLSHPSGSVTVGLILESGTPKKDCNGVTMGGICRDTFWYHNWYSISSQLNTDFDIKSSGKCDPFELQIFLKDSIGENLIDYSIDWGDGNVISQVVTPGDTIPGTYAHTYLAPGKYPIKVTMRNKKNCTNSTTKTISAGHKSVFTHKTNPCKGDCLEFNHEIRYYGDTFTYWSDTNRLKTGKESIRWDFGNGDFSSVSKPTWCFPDTGYHAILMITTDSLGCIDTAVSDFHIGGPKAVIKPGKERILCTEIVQFFDSSYMPNNTLGETIIGWRWDFGDGKSPSYLKDPFHFYSSFGEFTVRLVVTTDKGCKDTAYKTVFVEGPQASFEFVTDTIGCAPLSVEMKNTSKHVISWIWYFGDQGGSTFPTTNDSNVKFTYNLPGTYHLYLYAADSIYNPATGNRQYCTVIFPDTSVPGQKLKTVIVQPTPPVDFNIPDTLCVNVKGAFVDRSDTMYKNYRWYIFQGDSIISHVKINPYTFTKPGNYRVDYRPTYDPGQGRKGCFDSATKNVTVVDVKALFEIDPVKSSSMEKFFINQSTGAVRYEWNFGQPSSGVANTSVLEHPKHIYYPEAGTFTVCLKAYNSQQCSDVYCMDVTTSIDNFIFIPNVFTPSDGNNMNDAFDILIDAEDSYDLRIYNRWGELVFEGDRDGVGRDGINWNGKYRNDGKECPAGVYYVIFDYNFKFSPPVRYTGTLTLIR